jgi:cell division protein FtsW
VAAPDTFGRFLALGIAVLFGIEATVNMCVVTGLLPTKGLALPFISYGGSSLLISLFAVGILLNISSGLKIEPIKLKEEK